MTKKRLAILFILFITIFVSILIYLNNSESSAVEKTTTRIFNVNPNNFPGYIDRAVSHLEFAVDARDKKTESFQNSPDIWKFATDALKTDKPGLLYEAYTGAKECQGIVAIGESLKNFASGAKDSLTRGPLTVERQQAISILLKRCAGFFSNGAEASRRLTVSLEKKGKSYNAPEFAPFEKGLSLDEKVNGFARLQSPSAREGAVLSLAKLSEFIQSSSSNRLDDRETVTGTAAVLSLCQLGRDCSTDSLAYSVNCALYEKCGNSLWDGWESTMSNMDAMATKALVFQVTEYVHKNEIALLGH